MILRELFVALGLDVDEQSFARGQLAADAVKFALGSLVEVGKEVAHAMVAQTMAVIEYTDTLDDASVALGINVVALQEYQYAASFVGIGNEELTAGFSVLSRAMRAAAEGSETQQAAFRRLGVRVKDENGKFRGLEEVFNDIASGMEKMPEGAERTAMAMDLFGRHVGVKMIPLLSGGRKGLAQLREEAHAMGMVFDEATVKIGGQLSDEIGVLTRGIKVLWANAIGPLLPRIRAVVLRMLEWVKANGRMISQRLEVVLSNVVRAAEYLSRAIGALGTVVEHVFKNLEFFGALLAVLAVRMVVLEGASILAAGRVALAWAAAAAPFLAIGAVIAALFLLYDDLKVYLKDLADPSRGTNSMLGRWQKAIDEWMQPREGDPWFVVALKTFMSLLAQARALMLEMVMDWERHYERMVGIIKYLPPVLIGRGVVGGIEGAVSLGRRAFGGAPQAPESMMSMPPAVPMSVVLPPSVPIPGPGPMVVPVPSRGTGSSSKSMSLNMTINAASGQSEEAIARAARAEIEEWWAAEGEAAYAAVK